MVGTASLGAAVLQVVFTDIVDGYSVGGLHTSHESCLEPLSDDVQPTQAHRLIFIKASSCDGFIRL